MASTTLSISTMRSSSSATGDKLAPCFCRRHLRQSTRPAKKSRYADACTDSKFIATWVILMDVVRPLMMTSTPTTKKRAQHTSPPSRPVPSSQLATHAPP